MAVVAVLAAALASLAFPLGSGQPRRFESARTGPVAHKKRAPRPQRRRRAANVYAAATASQLPRALADLPQRVYVPNSDAGTLDVIDPRRLRVVGHYRVGAVPHHVTPSWGLRRLYVNNTVGNSLTEIDPRKAEPVRTIPVEDPYNLYFTPDGSKAIVVAERFQRLDVRDPHSWKLKRSIRVP